MAYPASVIEIFLSSPSDLDTEREIVIACAAEWNQLRGRKSACFISILTWENSVAPSLQERPQEAINQQVGCEYDVYLGMLWTRIGTETGISVSGTVEEYNQAVSLARSNTKLKVATLFKTAQLDLSEIDPDQWKGVQEFKRRISDEGMFYREFSSDNALRRILSLLFEQIANEYGSALANSEGVEKKLVDSAPRSLVYSDQIIDNNDIEDIGLLEIGDEVTKTVNELVHIMTELSKSENAHTRNMSECSDEISFVTKFGKPDASALKRIMSKAASGMNLLSEDNERFSSSLDALQIRLGNLIDAELRIRLDFSDPETQTLETRESLIQLIDVIEIAIGNMDDVIRGVSGLPCLSGEVNKAKKVLVKSRIKVRASFTSLRDSINASLSSFAAAMIASGESRTA